MTVPEFRQALKHEPFRPFNLRLADGRSLPVLHPEFAVVEPQSTTVIVVQPEGGFNIVDLLLVTDFEFAPIRNKQ